MKNEWKHTTGNGPVGERLANSDQASQENIHHRILMLPQEKANRKSGFQNGKRGRKPAIVPSKKNLEVLLATTNKTFEQVGATYSISKQRVSQITKRWKEYLPVRSLRISQSAQNNPMPKLVEKRERRIHVIAFRLTDPEFRLLLARYPESKSAAGAARHIVTKLLSL